VDDPVERTRDHATVEYGELPELTRGLRALGSSRDGRGGSLQSQFFLPLIDARRRAAAAKTPGARLKSFDAAELSRSLTRFLERIVTDWPDKRDSVRRALRAELKYRATPYVAALARLGVRATEADEADEATRRDAWRAWTTELAATFQAADLTWLALRSAVETLPPRK
jgi:hypothetical protein